MKLNLNNRGGLKLMGAVSVLGIISYIIGFAKEIFIILLIYKAIKVLNIYIKKNEVPFSKCKGQKVEEESKIKENINNKDENEDKTEN